MQTSRFRLVFCVAALLLLAGALPARPGTSFDFLFSMDHVTNDQQMFLNLTVDHSGVDRVVLEPILPRLRTIEADLPVVLFLAQRCGRPVEAIVDLRAQGLSWSVVFGRVGVPIDVLFVGIDRDPGPPYGKAWGYWKKNPREVRLADGDIRGLVQIQLGSRWAGTSPLQMAHARGGGKSVAALVAEKHGRPYEGKSHGKGKGSGKGGNRGSH